MNWYQEFSLHISTIPPVLKVQVSISSFFLFPNCSLQLFTNLWNIFEFDHEAEQSGAPFTWLFAKNKIAFCLFVNIENIQAQGTSINSGTNSTVSSLRYVLGLPTFWSLHVEFLIALLYYNSYDKLRYNMNIITPIGSF